MKISISLLFAVVIIVGSYLYTKDRSQIDQEVVLYTSEVSTFDASDSQFYIQYSDDAEYAQLSLNGVQYDLKQIVTASGVKYENYDGTVIFWEHQSEATIEMNGETIVAKAKASISTDPGNVTYLIDEVSYTLKDGSLEVSTVPGSASLTTVNIFGEPAYGDVDADGDDDAVLLLTVEGGGSGTFFYGALAINNNGIYTGTDTILLGDRIAPQSYRIVDGKGEINYVVRAYGESMDVRPSIGKTLLIKHDQETNRLIEIEVNFEGEASPEVMILTMKPWVWVVADYTDSTSVKPEKVDDFVLTFTDEGVVSASTDCNSMSGTYTKQDNMITFGSLAMTKMFCESSQEGVFVDILNNTESFEFTSKGELKLLFKGGVATLK